jgi:hypothetical protein
LEVFPAKTSALRDVVRAWQESAADFSSKLSDLQKKFSRRLCFSKTCPQLELADFERSQEHLPIYGMTVDGLVYLPQKLAPLTLGKDGSFLPTPTVQDACGRTHHNQANGGTILSLLGVVTSKDGKHPTPGGKLNPTWVEWLMGFPLEWTVLEDWATQWFQVKRTRLLKSY